MIYPVTSCILNMKLILLSYVYDMSFQLNKKSYVYDKGNYYAYAFQQNG